MLIYPGSHPFDRHDKGNEQTFQTISDKTAILISFIKSGV